MERAISGRGQRAVLLLLLASQFVAFWPVWRWFVERLLDGSDEPYGVLAMIIALVSVLGRRICRPSTEVVAGLGAIAVAYVLWIYRMPLLIQGVLMCLALSLLISSSFYGRTVHLGIVGLLILSLPLIASLQFFLGFPVRILTTQIVAHLVSLAGFPVTPTGTMLQWRGDMISIDAPCAGIKMLWSGLFLHFTLSTFREISNRTILLGYSLSMGVVFLGNILRTTALFFTEARIIPAPEWVHPGIGVVSFIFICAGIIVIHSQIGGGKRCEA